MNRHSSYKPRARTRALVFTSLCSLLAAATLEAAPPPWHYTGRIGLSDARHTAADGTQASDLVALGEGGHVLGTSDLFVGEPDANPQPGRRAQSGWVAGSSGTTYRVGLYDADHTRVDGRQETYPLAINASGVSVGVSTRFSDAAFAGTSAWVATSGGATIQLGFYDAAHRASDGGTLSAPIALNGANKLIGYSENPETGHRSGWIANSIGQIGAIGLVDADHTATDGHHAVFPVALNDAGYIVGNSDFFAAGGFAPGSTAWLRRPDRSLRLIGFQSGVHASASGQHLSRVELLTQSGYASGWSARYGSGSAGSIGQTAWVTHADGPNRPVGLYSDQHVGPTGSVHSQVFALNERGYAIGTSYQYDGVGLSEFDQAGSSTWIATPSGTTVRIGLYDAEHSVGGHQFNDVVALNGVDALIGSAARYTAGGAYHGMDAFVANAAGYTTRIALTDAMHTRDDGYHASFPTAITDNSGLVAGYSERYNGGSEQVGQTAWIYTRSSRTFVRLEISVRPSDGYAESHITDLREDGSAVGYFRLFSGTGADLGERAFAYLPASSVHVLEDNLDVTLASTGWAYLAEASALSGGGAIAGVGALAPGSVHGHGVFLLDETAVTPQPQPTRVVALNLRLTLPLGLSR